MARYRLLEIKDTLINDGEPFWRVEKKNWFGYWTEYFEEHSDGGATFYDKQVAEKWYNYHIQPAKRYSTKVIAQN